MVDMQTDIQQVYDNNCFSDKEEFVIEIYYRWR